MTDLTSRQKQTLDALRTNWMSASQIANTADYGTHHPRETESKFADQLFRLGLAEKGGTRMYPMWKIKEDPHV